MRSLRIIANGIELNFVKETLTLKRDNNAMIRDFRTNYSNNPFMVVDDAHCVKALGSRDMKSVNKQTVFEVLVYEADVAYKGELQVLSCVKGYRKCNLKYGTELISIMSKKLAEFMPRVSVIPLENNPAPYVEENEGLIDGYGNWGSYPLSFLDDVFPSVQWQFPTLYWKNRFGVNLDENDPWLNYENEVNKYDEFFSFMIQNTFDIDENGILSVDNKNVISPQVFLLSPLFYALNSLGWKANGNFYTNAFINRILILNSNHNMTKVKLFGTDNPIDFDSIPWDHRSVGTPFERYQKDRTYSVTEAGTYTFTFSLTMTGPFNNNFNNYFGVAAPGESSISFVISINYLFETSKTYTGVFEVTANSPGNFFLILNFRELDQFGDFSLSIRKNEEKYFMQPHPTIESGRYVPDWTFGTYLNQLKNFFNLDIDIDDFTKTMSLNFFDDIVANEVPVKIKSLLNEAHDLPTTQAFVLKYENDEDEAAWITSSGAVLYTNQKNDFTETLDCKFKFVKNNAYTAELSESLFDKDGVGLMIYDPQNRPYISENYLGQHLGILGNKGIYDSFWRKTLRVRLNASVCEVEGPFSKTEVSKIIKSNVIYLNSQEFLVETVSYSEVGTGLFNMKFKLHTKTL